MAAERPAPPAVGAPDAANAPNPPTVRRKLPAVRPPAARPVFSDPPTAMEIAKARIFEEPLVADGATTAADNQALTKALKLYLDAPRREDVAALDGFLQARPASPWKASLLTNLGIVALRTGYTSKALDYFEQSW